MKEICGFKRRPCRICRRWFSPNPRVGDRQMTCGDPECKRKWHSKKCSIWNKNNVEYFREIYLRKKLASADKTGNDFQSAQGLFSPILYRHSLKLPEKGIQEVIGVKQFVIIEYICQVFSRRFQEVIKSKLIVNTG